MQIKSYIKQVLIYITKSEYFETKIADTIRKREKILKE